MPSDVRMSSTRLSVQNIGGKGDPNSSLAVKAVCKERGAGGALVCSKHSLNYQKFINND